jgi:hypothetical protein
MGRPRIAVALLAALLAAPAASAQGLLGEPVRVRRSAADPAPTADDRPPRDPDTASTPAGARPPPPPRRGARVRGGGDRTVSAAVVERSNDARPSARNPDDEDLLDFVGRRSTLGRDRERSSGKFGDRIKEMLAPGDQRGWFFSDHAFDCFATPVSNPFLFEDPRALTEVRPVFIYQSIPGGQPTFRGGNIWFLGARGSLAITDRLSLTVNKLGGIALNPGGESGRESHFGFAELWLGPKVTILRDPGFGSILSAGAIFQIPAGSKEVYQDTGNLSIAPYVSYGKTLAEFRRLGSVNGILNAGYSFGTTRERSDYFYANAHLDVDAFNRHRFYPLAELNWFQYTTNGTTQAVSGEGRDLFNFGSASKGANLLTGALGFRFKIIEAAQLGAAFELPLIGNKDLTQYRFTLDLIFRY